MEAGEREKVITPRVGLSLLQTAAQPDREHPFMLDSGAGYRWKSMNPGLDFEDRHSWGYGAVRGMRGGVRQVCASAMGGTPSLPNAA